MSQKFAESTWGFTPNTHTGLLLDKETIPSCGWLSTTQEPLNREYLNQELFKRMHTVQEINDALKKHVWTEPVNKQPETEWLPRSKSAYFMCYDSPVYHKNLHAWRNKVYQEIRMKMCLISSDAPTLCHKLGIAPNYMGYFVSRNSCSTPGFEMICLIDDIVALYVKLKQQYRDVQIYPIPRTRIELKELLSLSGPYVRAMVDGKEKVVSFATELSKGKYKTLAGYQLIADPRMFDIPEKKEDRPKYSTLNNMPKKAKTHLTDLERSKLRKDLMEKIRLVGDSVEDVSDILGIPVATLRAVRYRCFTLTNDVMLHYVRLIDGYLVLKAKSPGLKIRFKQQPTTFKEMVARGLVK